MSYSEIKIAGPLEKVANLLVEFQSMATQCNVRITPMHCNPLVKGQICRTVRIAVGSPIEENMQAFQGEVEKAMLKLMIEGKEVPDVVQVANSGLSINYTRPKVKRDNVRPLLAAG